MNPAITLLRIERDKKQQQLDGLLDAVKQARADLRSFDEAIAMLEGGSAASSPPAPRVTIARHTGHQPPLKVIVGEILRERPGQNPSEITAALAARGRETDINTVLGTLSRARKEGLIHKQGRVWFDGAGNFTSDDVMSESAEASDRSEASEETGAGDGSQGRASHPSPAGSTPVGSTSIRKDLLSSVSGLPGPIQAPPWKR